MGKPSDSGHFGANLSSLCDFTQPPSHPWLDISAIMSTLCPAGVTPRKLFGFGISFICSPDTDLRPVSSVVQFPRVNPGDVECSCSLMRPCTEQQHNAMSSTIASCSRGLSPLPSNYRSLPCLVPARLPQSGNRSKHGTLPCVPVWCLHTI